LRTHISLEKERNKEKKRMAENRNKERNEGKARKKTGKERNKEIKREIDVRYEVLKVLALKIQVLCIVGFSIRVIYCRRFEQTL